MAEIVFVKGVVAVIEDQIISQLQQYGEDEPLLLDMSNIEFIRVEAMVYLISFIAKRKTKEYETKIKYYNNELIRKFLHNCRFFEVIKDVADIDIHDIAIDLPDYFDKTYLAVDYFNKPKYEITPEYTRELTEKEKIDYMRDKGFYPLVSLPFNDNIEKSYTLKEEPKNWTEGKPLVSLIQKNLPDKTVIGDKISKHIIYESITNSIRHPSAKKLIISCIRQGNYYTLVIWDNGESIIETLKKELEKGNSVKTENELPDDPHSCYCIIKEKKLGPPKVDYFDYYFSYEVPNIKEVEEGMEYKKEEWFILLSSFFPGITRDPKGIDYQQSEVLNKEQKPPSTGRGLTYLINAAVRNFGGEVRIRTNNHFINIKKAEKDYKTLPDLFFDKFKNDYYVIDMKEKYDVDGITPKDKKIINSLFRAKIQEFPKKEGFFFGNMITIHIPQR